MSTAFMPVKKKIIQVSTYK